MSSWQWTSGVIFILLCLSTISEQGFLKDVAQRRSAAFRDRVKNVAGGIHNTKNYIKDKLHVVAPKFIAGSVTKIATGVHNVKNHMKSKLHDISPHVLGPIADVLDPEWLLKMNYSRWLHDMDQVLKEGKTMVWVKMIRKQFNIERVTNEIKTSMYGKATCLACKFLIKLGRSMMMVGKSDQDIVDLLSRVCTVLEIQTARVCSGIMNLIGIDAIQAVRKSPMRSAQICSFYLNDACINGYDERHQWQVKFPPKRKPNQHPPSPSHVNSRPLKVLQITDSHYDPHYREGANVDCGEPLCCRAVDGQPASDSVTAGKWGDYRKCDTPVVLFENALQHIADAHEDIDYIIWTGDAPPHDIWNQTREANLANMKFSAQLIDKYFKGIQIYPSIGNHESCPVDSFGGTGAPPHTKMSWLYNELDREWSRWLPPYTSKTIRHGAYYSVLVKPGFRIISVNGNYCGRYNFWLLINSVDPAGVLQWLIRELDRAEANGEKVHIIGHVPPGGNDCMKVWSRNYYDIINRYEHIIMAQFFGHTHYDEFEVFYDTKDLKRPLNVGYVSPSITPWENVNPAYRIYYVEGDHSQTNRAILDHETWKMDLDVANRIGEPVWYKAYSARQAYNMASLHPSEWNNLITRMMDDKDLFEVYHRNYYRNSPVRPKCDDECRRRLLCDLRSGRSNDKENLCYDI